MILMIIFLPLFSSLITGLGGRLIGFKGARIFSSSLLLINTFLCLFLINDIIINKILINWKLWSWFNLGLLHYSFGFKLDILISGMLFLVNFISSLVHIFSASYMSEDPHLPRFMSYLSLFTFFMIILVSSSSIIQLFIGWEGVGLCSFLLINFWFSRIQANKSAIKAMIVNKIGDIGLLLGLILLWMESGCLTYNSLFSYFNIQSFNKTIFIIALLLILLGIVGKSAQIGLHMWLPDAMEGPTPVSALIHAATMVTAGVFLLIRLSPLFELIPSVLILIVFIGSITAFISSFIGSTQNDLKKVIAYSTCSQLGYMITICGFSSYNLGLFHLLNHGFFKALLFLSAGSIIHALGDEQDFRKMGGTKTFLPLTYILVVIGSFSLMGLPFLTGFYSKDLIIEFIFGSNLALLSLILLIFAALLTAFYSCRLIFFVFLNRPQTNKNKFSNIHEGDILLLIPIIFLGVFSIINGYYSQYYILKDFKPIMIYFFSKLSPLIIGIIGFFCFILLSLNLKKTWNLKFNNLLTVIYNISIYLFYFDNLISYYLIKRFMNLGYHITYKLIDNQYLEFFGPFYFFNNVSKFSNSISKIHSGRISSYLFIFVIFIFIFILSIN